MPNPHITVPDETPFAEFDVTASTSSFAFTFTFFDRDDLRVTVNDEELDDDEFEVTTTTAYEGGYVGGTVVLGVAIANSNLKIWSDIPPARTNDFLEGGGFRATPVNTEIDRLTARQRDMRLRFQRIPTFSSSIDRAIRSSEMGCQWTNNAASGAIEYTLPAASAGLHAWFAVANALSMTVSAHSDDTIYGTSSTGTELASSAVGSILHLVSPVTGVWVVETQNGTWALT